MKLEPVPCAAISAWAFMTKHGISAGQRQAGLRLHLATGVLRRAEVPSPTRRLWKCPKCGHRFVTANLSHSCGRYRLAAHFAGKSGAVRAAFSRLVAVAPPSFDSH